MLYSILLIILTFFVTTSVYADQTVYLQHDGVTRNYIVHLPTGYKKTKVYPVFLVLHGGLGSAAGMPAYSKFNKVADEHKVVAVYPDGMPKDEEYPDFHYWNDGRPDSDRLYDDVGFIKAVIANLRNRGLKISHVYSCGISNGSQMSIRLAKELPEISGVGAVCGHRGPDEWIPAQERPVPILFIQGYLDQYALFYGGIGKADLEFQPFLDVLKQWLDHNNCFPIPTINFRIGDAEYWEYQGDAPVGVWICYDNGHQWPGTDFDYALWLLGCGPINNDIQASKEIVEFFLK